MSQSSQTSGGPRSIRSLVLKHQEPWGCGEVPGSLLKPTSWLHLRFQFQEWELVAFQVVSMPGRSAWVTAVSPGPSIEALEETRVNVSDLREHGSVLGAQLLGLCLV